MSEEEKHYEAVHNLIEHNQEQSEKHRIAYGKEMFNLGVDHCIGVIKSRPDLVSVGYYDFVISIFEQLKKQQP